MSEARMECRDVREVLWPPERPRLAESKVLNATRHVALCAACRDYFAQDRALLDAYDQLRQYRAPLALRQKVFDTLARQRLGGAPLTEEVGRSAPPRHRGRHWLVPGAAATVALAAALVWLPGRGPLHAAREGQVFVEDYLRRAVGQDHIVSSDPVEVSRFLERELGMDLTPIRASGLLVERAEICLLEGRRGAMIVYKKEGAAVSHYLVPRDGARARRPSVSRGEGLAARRPVVTWSTPSLEQALVGELPEEELLALARTSGA